MKSTWSLLIAIVYVFSNGYAQTYYPMPSDSATWTVVQYGYGVTPPETGVTHFGLAGDTVIDAFTYHKIYYNYGGLGFVNPDSAFNLQTASLYGVFREDSSKKVWFRQLPFDSTDILMYNFALNVGDTFCFYDEPCGVLCHPVSLIDSILINGSYRRQIHFNYAGQEETWIEGIGSIYDNWDGHWCFTGNIAWFLNCYAERGVHIFGDCDFPTGINETSEESSALKMFPNPVDDFLMIENGIIGANISIKNVLGQHCFSHHLTSGKLQMEVGFLEAGIYFLHYTGDKHERTIRFIKQ